MATVKFSEELRERIANVASSKFQDAINKAVASAPKDWGDKLYDYAFAPYVDAMEALPKGFLPTRSNIVVDNIQIPKEEEVHVGLEFKFTDKKLFPFAYPSKFPWQKCGNYGDAITIRYSDVLEEFVNEVRAWNKRKASAVARQAEFKQSVRKVVDAYATLAPALKAWPPLWDLIPDDVKTKHKLIVEREVKTREIDVDLDRMTAMAAFTKIRGNE